MFRLWGEFSCRADDVRHCKCAHKNALNRCLCLKIFMKGVRLRNRDLGWWKQIFSKFFCGSMLSIQTQIPVRIPLHVFAMAERSPLRHVFVLKKVLEKPTNSLGPAPGAPAVNVSHFRHLLPLEIVNFWKQDNSSEAIYIWNLCSWAYQMFGTLVTARGGGSNSQCNYFCFHAALSIYMCILANKESKQGEQPFQHFLK